MAATTTGPKSNCPECGKEISTKNIPAHRRRVHKVAMRTRQTKPQPDNLPVPVPHNHAPPSVRFIDQREALILTDSTGQIWLAERLK